MLTSTKRNKKIIAITFSGIEPSTQNPLVL